MTSTRLVIPLLLLSVATAMSACDPARRDIPREAAVVRAMAHDQEAAVRLRDGVVHGDLDAAHAEARAFLSHLGEAPPGLEVERAALVAAVEEVQAAPSVGSAAAGAGRMAVACGACHEKAHPTISAPVAAKIPGDGVRAEMARHSDALDLLWAGLIRPSSADLEGAAVLFEAGLFAPAGGASPDAAALDDRVTTQARAIAAAPDAPARAAAVGELLATCATCHTTRPGGVALEPE